MIPLQEEYTVKGQKDFVYCLMKREGMVAMVQQLNKETREFIAFEVFQIIQYPDRWSPDGKVFIKAKETPPSSEMWGAKGWTIHTPERAEAKFKELCEKVNDSLTMIVGSTTMHIDRDKAIGAFERMVKKSKKSDNAS